MITELLVTVRYMVHVRLLFNSQAPLTAEVTMSVTFCGWGNVDPTRFVRSSEGFYWPAQASHLGKTECIKGDFK
jgi:hypothetical protein